MKSALNRTAEQWVSRAATLLAQHPKQVTLTLASVLLMGTGLTYAVANLAPDAADLPVRSITEALPAPVLPLLAQDLQDQALRLYRSETTRSTDTAETLLKRLGVFDPKAAAYLRTDPLAQKNLLGRPGRMLTAEASGDNALLKLQARWSPDEDGSFKRLTIEKTAEGFRSAIETLPLTASTRMASGSIATSLFAATDDARLPDSVAGQMAEIFSGDIDFHRALRKGDRFSVVYETLMGDGEPLRAGRVLSAEFVNAGKSYQAMWFQEPDNAAGTALAAQAQRKGAYYTLTGESLKRSFLASPMEFSRVTSGFSMRFHPILQVWRAHLGVDYGAPIGTPVRSVGDGVVEFAGVQNGFGNVVHLRHANQITTVYAHLSRINVRQGQPVSQGQNIGLVGKTGWATGPHLHFEYRINGVYQDPQKVALRNQTLPVTAALKPVFDKAAAHAREALAVASQMQVGSVE